MWGNNSEGTKRGRGKYENVRYGERRKNRDIDIDRSSSALAFVSVSRLDTSQDGMKSEKRLVSD